MTQDPRFKTLLDECRKACTALPAFHSFVSFPNDITPQAMTPDHQPCADVFKADTSLASKNYPALHTAIYEAGDIAHWRETYKGTDIGADFMDRFGCYCIIGDDAPFISDHIRLFMVYMPPNLYYPWHHHPAEEIYFVVSGHGVFKREGDADENLTEGDTSFHHSNQPHALHTTDSGILCLVAWHDQFDTPPVLTQ